VRRIIRFLTILCGYLARSCDLFLLESRTLEGELLISKCELTWTDGKQETNAEAELRNG
jgi:hypothetical protein